jgi:predicted nucleic acid-binding protein
VIVLDASAVVELLLQTTTGVRVGQRIASRVESLHAPHLLDIEVAQVLRRFEAGGALTPERAEQALADLLDLDVRRHAHDLLLPRVWQLRHNLTAYDAAYVALAEALDAPLVTTDGRVARAKGHEARVEAL